MREPSPILTRTARLVKLAVGIATATVLPGALVTPAYASTGWDVPPIGTSDVSIDGLYAYVDGEYQLVEAVKMERADTKSSPEPSPYLLDLVQWTQCWVVNDVHHVLREYTHVLDGQKSTVTLKCGNSDFGYKHIAEHESDWQSQLDSITPPGMVPDKSWDDLMSAASANAIRRWEIKVNQEGNKTCVIGTLYWTVGGVITHPFKTRTVWSKNNMHVITSFPNAAGACPER